MTLHTPVITPGAIYMLWLQFKDEKFTKQQNDKFDYATYYEAYSCSILNSPLTLNQPSLDSYRPGLQGIGYKGSSLLTYATGGFNGLLEKEQTNKYPWYNIYSESSIV